LDNFSSQGREREKEEEREREREKMVPRRRETQSKAAFSTENDGERKFSSAAEDSRLLSLSLSFPQEREELLMFCCPIFLSCLSRSLPLSLSLSLVSETLLPRLNPSEAAATSSILFWLPSSPALVFALRRKGKVKNRSAAAATAAAVAATAVAAAAAVRAAKGQKADIQRRKDFLADPVFLAFLPVKLFYKPTLL